MVGWSLFQVAYNQVTSHLYMPRLDGTLQPGQGHPRCEEPEVANVVGGWAAGGWVMVGRHMEAVILGGRVVSD